MRAARAPLRTLHVAHLVTAQLILFYADRWRIKNLFFANIFRDLRLPPFLYVSLVMPYYDRFRLARTISQPSLKLLRAFALMLLHTYIHHI